MKSAGCRPTAGGDFAESSRQGDGVNEVVGVATILLGSALLIGARFLVRPCWRWLRSLPPPSVAQVSTWSAAMGCAAAGCLAAEPDPELSALTDEELCDEWRSSYLALQRRLSDRQVIALVQERQRYLDELERRHPRGLEAWLASGAWASSTPLPYLTESHSSAQVINWDQLMGEQGW